MKIFYNNLKNNFKTISLREKECFTGKSKYLPSFSKEWKNIVYSYNKNNIKNIPVNDLNINKIIQSYFNLYFKNSNYVSSVGVSIRKKFKRNQKIILMRKKRILLKRIYVSNAEIKHTNDKAIITLYTVNREKKKIIKNYEEIIKKVKKIIVKGYCLQYKNNIKKIYEIFKDNFSFAAAAVAAGSDPGLYRDQLKKKIPKAARARFFLYNPSTPKATPHIGEADQKGKKNTELEKKKQQRYTKKNFLDYKLKYLNKFLLLKNIYLKKIWSIIISIYCERYLMLLRKYELMYSLNQYKFNKKIFLPILSKILKKLITKKIEYNIINLKSITYNTDLFTHVLALKLKKKKIFYLKSLFSFLNKVYLPKSITIWEKTRIRKNPDPYLSKYSDLKVVSNLNGNDLDNLLGDGSSTKEVHNTIYNSIGYKNIGGIRIQVKGRLSKHNKAERSRNSLKWKGGLKNIDSSFKGLSSVLFRGKFNSNVSYSLSSSKRKVGAYAVKGWLSGR